MNNKVTRNIDDFSSIIAASVILTMGGLIFLVMPIYAGAAATSLGLNESEVGLIAATDFAGIALASILAPFWIRRINWRTAAGVAIGLMLLGNLVSIFANNFSDLIFVRIPTSFAGGSLASIGLASIADTSKKDRNFGIAVAIQTIAGTIGLFGFPYLVADWGVDSIFATLIVALLLVSPAIRFLTLGTRPKSTQGAQESILKLVPFVGLLGMLLFFSNIGAVWTYLERIGGGAGLSPTFIGNGLAFSNLVALLGAIAATVMGDRFGHLRPLILVVGAQLLALLMLSQRVDTTSFVVALCIYTFFWNFAIPSQMSATAKADPSGRLIVLATAFQGAGAAVGPATAAVFLQPNSFNAVYMTACVFCILSLIFFIPVCRYGVRKK